MGFVTTPTRPLPTPKAISVAVWKVVGFLLLILSPVITWRGWLAIPAIAPV